MDMFTDPTPCIIWPVCEKARGIQQNINKNVARFLISERFNGLKGALASLPGYWVGWIVGAKVRLKKLSGYDNNHKL
jgi:hypothetical protein